MKNSAFSEMTVSLSREEAVEILEEIARDGTNHAARIAAIKMLLEMRKDEQTPESAGWEELDRRFPGPQAK